MYSSCQITNVKIFSQQNKQYACHLIAHRRFDRLLDFNFMLQMICNKVNATILTYDIAITSEINLYTYEQKLFINHQLLQFQTF